MNSLHIKTDGDQTTFSPGIEISGTATWQLDQSPAQIELRLFWFTSGMGNEDIGIHQTISFDHASRQDSRPFRFQLPAAPCSFDGQLTTLNWALELVAGSGKEVARLEIIIAPDGTPPKLERLPHVKQKKSFFELGSHR
jgi:hypothetical protein